MYVVVYVCSCTCTCTRTRTTLYNYNYSTCTVILLMKYKEGFFGGSGGQPIKLRQILVLYVYTYTYNVSVFFEESSKIPSYESTFVRKYFRTLESTKVSIFVLSYNVVPSYDTCTTVRVVVYSTTRYNPLCTLLP